MRTVEVRRHQAGHQAPLQRHVRPRRAALIESLELAESPRRRLDSVLALIADFTREIEATTREVEARAEEDPYVEVLCQIRGVGRYIAMLVIAEVGDVSRFPTARHLCSWAGMTPTVRTSDQRTRLGHISRQGSPALLWALVEAAQHAARGGGPLRQAFERISKRRGRQIAKVAVARRILTFCYYGLRDGDPLRCAAGPPRTLRTTGGHPVIRPGAHVLNGPQATDSSGELACCQWPHLAKVGD